MRKLLVAMIGVALLAPGSAALSAGAAPDPSARCVSAADSVSGQAFCLDSSRGPLATGSYTAQDVTQDPAVLELNGWMVPTRCDGNGKSGKREQVIYVHVAGSPTSYSKQAAFIQQRVIPGANGVFEHSSNGKRAVRWVTTKKGGVCTPTILQVTVTKKSNTSGFPLLNIESALQKSIPRLIRSDRSYLVLVDQPDHPFGYPFSDCGLGDIRYDARPGAANVNNSGSAFATVWINCWGGITAAHELTHTMGAVQPTSPHHTDEGHCWDGQDAMCYADGSKQKQKLICKKPDDFRKLDCGGNDYFSIAPKPGSYLTKHWNSANSQFLIDSKPKVLPTLPGKPTGVTVTAVDATHVRVQWTPGVTRHGALTSWTVLVGAEVNGDVGFFGGASYPYVTYQKRLVLGANTRSAMVAVSPYVPLGFVVQATNASGDGPYSTLVVGGAGSPPSPIVATFTPQDPDGVYGYVGWTGGVSESATERTCVAVTVNGKRISNFGGTDETLANTTDPNGECDSDFAPQYVGPLVPTDVIHILSRNSFGVTAVTVAHG